MRTILTFLAAVCFASLAEPAAAQQSVNIRGTITGLEGTMVAIMTRQGALVTVDVPEKLEIRTTRPFSLAEIKPGMALGVTTIKRADGAIVAIDIRPISATANLGLSAYDLAPESTMTNASFEGMAEAANGNELTLNYKTGTVKVLVVPQTAMSQAAPGTRADLKVGETIFAAARKEGDKVTATRVQVSKDGVKPTQ